MRKLIYTSVLALPVAIVASFFVASAVGSAEQSRPKAGAYICPITGETLPCPNCCPLNRRTESRGQ